MNLERIFEKHNFDSMAPLVEAKGQADIAAWLVASLSPLLDDCNQRVANLELAHSEATNEANEAKGSFDVAHEKYQVAHQAYQGTLELTEARLAAGKVHTAKQTEVTRLWRDLSEARVKRDGLALLIDDLAALVAPSEQDVRDKAARVLGL